MRKVASLFLALTVAAGFSTFDAALAKNRDKSYKKYLKNQERIARRARNNWHDSGKRRGWSNSWGNGVGWKNGKGHWHRKGKGKGKGKGRVDWNKVN